MTESDANIYFITYKALLEEVDSPVMSSYMQGGGNQQQNRDLPLQDYQVDVRCFAVFIALQLFAS